MKTIQFLLSACMVYTLPAFALKAPVNPPAKIEGVYEYKVADAPYEYQQGTIELKKTNNQWTANLKVNYQTIEAKEVKVEKNQVQFKLYIEGNTILVKLIYKSGKMTGTASSDETGVMNIVADKKKKVSKK